MPFSYGDAQRYRLGVDFNHIPVNAPRCPFHSYHRDGAMRTDGNLGATPGYFPNQHGEWEVAAAPPRQASSCMATPAIGTIVRTRITESSLETCFG